LCLHQDQPPHRLQPWAHLHCSMSVVLARVACMLSSNKWCPAGRQPRCHRNACGPCGCCLQRSTQTPCSLMYVALAGAACMLSSKMFHILRC
jgi:hypothetical protein